MSRRTFREFVVMGCTVGGTMLGLCATYGINDPTIQLVLPFLGMALCGGCAEICMRD